MNIVTNLNDVGTMLAKRGLQKNGFTQRLFTVECARHMDKYVPMQSGTTKNTRIIDADKITYNVPQGRFLYYGKVMVAPSGSTWAKKGEKKTVTDRDLTYRGAPRRGKLWDKRMWADKKHAILKAVAKSAGGKVT